MADYHAVLQRTLSGFTDPKPELRTKLYERARTTIARQLESRSPAITGEALKIELDKLEQAIYEIEHSYDPTYPAPAPALAPKAEIAAPAVSPAPSVAAPQPPIAETPQPEFATEPPQPQPQPSPQPSPPPPPQVEPVTYSPTFADTLAGIPSVGEPGAAPLHTEFHTENLPQQPGFEPLNPADASALAPGQDLNDAAVDQWAEEFLSNPAGNEHVSDPVASEMPAAPPPPATPPSSPSPPPPSSPPLPMPTELLQPSQPAAPLEQNWQAAAPQEAPVAPVAPAYQAEAPVHAEAAIPAFEQPFSSEPDETLVIPPAPGFGNGATKRPRKGKILKWFLALLFLGLLGAAGAYGWINKELVLEKVGLSHLLDDPTRPKPVKTISITPQPASTDNPQPALKAESRLNENGDEVSAASSPAVTTPLQPVIETPVLENTASEQSVDGALPVAQNAILYEEGANAAANSVDAGRVVWSVIEEEPTSGVAKEPAIRARIEIPGRNVVLIMKIKRNADKALPASHLIELVFAVPDSFSGGAVAQVSRFVLKQSEQGRGEGLVGVPARIADGIFLIALNNLDQARKKNEALLKSRDWIDIPLKYRTGRRALMTIEKGAPGAKVFEEVFDAWSKL